MNIADFQFFNAVIGTTKTPSGLIYAALDIPQITQSTDGAIPPFAAIESRRDTRSEAALSI